MGLEDFRGQKDPRDRNLPQDFFEVGFNIADEEFDFSSGEYWPMNPKEVSQKSLDSSGVFSKKSQIQNHPGGFYHEGPTGVDEQPGSWRVDVTTTGDSTWATNALRFDTEENARLYARDLTGRWFAVKDYRIVPAETPDREPYVQGAGEWSKQAQKSRDPICPKCGSNEVFWKSEDSAALSDDGVKAGDPDVVCDDCGKTGPISSFKKAKAPDPQEDLVKDEQDKREEKADRKKESQLDQFSQNPSAEVGPYAPPQQLENPGSDTDLYRGPTTPCEVCGIQRGYEGPCPGCGDVDPFPDTEHNLPYGPYAGEPNPGADVGPYMGKVATEEEALETLNRHYGPGGYAARKQANSYPSAPMQEAYGMGKARGDAERANAEGPIDMENVSGPLSGEWAGDPVPHTLLEELGVPVDDLDAEDIAQAYEDGYYEALGKESSKTKNDFGKAPDSGICRNCKFEQVRDKSGICMNCGFRNKKSAIQTAVYREEQDCEANGGQHEWGEYNTGLDNPFGGQPHHECVNCGMIWLVASDDYDEQGQLVGSPTDVLGSNSREANIQKVICTCGHEDDNHDWDTEKCDSCDCASMENSWDTKTSYGREKERCPARLGEEERYNDSSLNGFYQCTQKPGHDGDHSFGWVRSSAQNSYSSNPREANADHIGTWVCGNCKTANTDAHDACSVCRSTFSARERSRHCPVCSRESILDGTCKSCGYAPAAVATKRVAKEQCRNCGEPVPSDAEVPIQTGAWKCPKCNYWTEVGKSSTKKQADYNGWSNWATWNAGLWLEENEGIYGDVMRVVNRALDADDLAERLESEFGSYLSQVPDFEGDISEVDWDELAEGYLDEGGVTASRKTAQVWFSTVDGGPTDEVPEEWDGYIDGGSSRGYSVSLDQKHIGDFSSHEEAEAALKSAIQESSYYPNCWFIDDHGGATLISVDDGKYWASKQAKTFDVVVPEGSVLVEAESEEEARQRAEEAGHTVHHVFPFSDALPKQAQGEPVGGSWGEPTDVWVCGDCGGENLSGDFSCVECGSNAGPRPDAKQADKVVDLGASVECGNGHLYGLEKARTFKGGCPQCGSRQWYNTSSKKASDEYQAWVASNKEWFDGTSDSIYHRISQGKRLLKQAQQAGDFETADALSEELETLASTAEVYDSFDENEFLGALPGGTVANDYTDLTAGGLVNLGLDDGSWMYQEASKVQAEAEDYDWEAFSREGAEQWVISQVEDSPDMLHHEVVTRQAAVDYAKDKTMVLVDPQKRAGIIDAFVRTAEVARRKVVGALFEKNAKERQRWRGAKASEEQLRRIAEVIFDEGDINWTP